MNTTPRKFYAADIPASGQPDKKLSIYKDGVIYEGYYTSGISHSFDLKLICLLDHCFKDGQNVTGLYTKRYEVDISAGNGKWEPVSAEYFNTCKDEYRRVIAIPTPDNKLTPMAAHIEWLKKERKACYELCHDEQVKCFDDAIKHATPLLEAEREYASQQAPASTPPVSANNAELMDVDKPDGVYAVNLNWGINYHPTDLSKVMKAKDCLFIGTGKECADFIYKNKPAPVSAMEDGWVKVEVLHVLGELIKEHERNKINSGMWDEAKEVYQKNRKL